MKNYLAIFLVSYISILGCNKDNQQSNLTAVWKNNTGHDISVATYIYGIKKDTVKIGPMGEFEIANMAARGRILKPFFSSSYLSDSSIVIFDGKFTITHYSTKVVTQSVKNYYEYNSSKNLQNFINYEFTSKVIKTNTYNHHIYYFTEDQYLDATK